MLTSLMADKNNQTSTQIIESFMNKYVNPPYKSSITTSCAKSVMTSSCGEVKVAALFTEGVSSSAEEELATDETASTVSLLPNGCVVPEMSVAVQEGKECVQESSF